MLGFELEFKSRKKKFEFLTSNFVRREVGAAGLSRAMRAPCCALRMGHFHSTSRDLEMCKKLIRKSGLFRQLLFKKSFVFVGLLNDPDGSSTCSRRE